jgi:uncharacterized phage protein gp47/JayE
MYGSEYGVTATGFIPKDETTIYNEMLEDAKELFGLTQDLTIYDPIGQQIAINARALANAWEGLEDAYYSFYIDGATGIQLDRVVALRGVTRQPAQEAYGNCTLTAIDSDITIAIGDVRAQTNTGVIFVNTEAGTITSTGTSIAFECETAGLTGIVAANTITEFVSPVAGLESVNNTTAFSGGSEIETDPELRARYKLRETTSGASVPALLSALLGTDGVTDAYVIENSANTSTGLLSPHSIQCLVVSDGAHNSDIADTIFNNKAAGIEPIGDITVNVTDDNGDTHPMKWDAPDPISVNVLVQITSTGDSTWLDANKAVIRQKIVEVIGGVNVLAGETTGTEYSGLDIGEDVKSWQLIAEFDDITGVDYFDVYLNTYPSTPTSARKVAIAYNEYAKCDGDGSDTYSAANNIKIEFV